MHPMSKRAGVSLLFVIAGCCLTTAPSASAQAPKDFFGVAPQAGLTLDDFRLMREDGVGSTRQLFFWPLIESTPGTYDWGPTDTLVREASKEGIEIFPVLYGTPPWAQTEKLQRKCGVTCGPVTDEAREGFARFAAAAVARYGPGGKFFETVPDPPPGSPPPPPPPPPPPCPLPPLLCHPSNGLEPLEKATPCMCPNPIPVTAWQIWNEQNSFKYWGPKEDLGSFAALMKATAPRMRAVDPAADLVLGGMWGPPGIKIITPVQRYLKKLYRIDGIEATFDSIALHPYAPKFSSTTSQLKNVRKLLKRVGDREAGLWVTELGWASSGPKREGLVKSKKDQARLLRTAYSLLLKKRDKWNIRGVFWYSWRDSRAAKEICAWCPKTGLRTEGGAPKPAAAAFRELAFKHTRP
jgi:hypothetical protein